MTPKDWKKIWNKFMKPEEPLSRKNKTSSDKKDKPKKCANNKGISTRNKGSSQVVLSPETPNSSTSNPSNKNRHNSTTKSNSRIPLPKSMMTTIISQTTIPLSPIMTPTNKSIPTKKCKVNSLMMMLMSSPNPWLIWKNDENNSRNNKLRNKKNSNSPLSMAMMSVVKSKSSNINKWTIMISIP